jgi:hypothetical protein
MTDYGSNGVVIKVLEVATTIITMAAMYRMLILEIRELRAIVRKGTANLGKRDSK